MSSHYKAGSRRLQAVFLAAAAAITLSALYVHTCWRADEGVAPSERSPPPIKPASDATSDTRHKRILLVTKREPEEWFPELGHAPFAQCSGNPVARNCHVEATSSWNTDDDAVGPTEYDAVVFDMWTMNSSLNHAQRRRPDQLYVMFLVESPATADFELPADFFNWTVTYMEESEVPHPYGWVTHRGEEQRRVRPGEWRRFDMAEFRRTLADRPPEFHALAHRPGLVAWIVSHCETNSDREGYVRRLARHIPVDIFGKCGQTPCDRPHYQGAEDNCSRALDASYLFYLAFENSLCEEYVTEKLWKRVGQSVVPVVMNGAGELLSRKAPPHAYIDVADFGRPAELARRLREIAADEAEYLSYFWWKDHYEAHVKDGKQPAFCNLCEILNGEGAVPEPKTYGDLDRWFREGGRCRQKGSFPWSMKKTKTKS